MGYKVGFLLSALLILELFILAGDVFSAQVIYTNLDAVSVTAGNIISSKGGITQDLINLVYDQTGGIISAAGDETPLFGSVYTFKISKWYEPMSRFNREYEISVVRSVVIGYFN